MAREHVFPVCSPNFNVLDFDTVDESQSYPLTSPTEAYGGVSSTGVETAVFFNAVNNEVAFSTFIIEDGGEYLVNDNISIPSQTTLDWTGDANGIQINAYNFGSVKAATSGIFEVARNATKATKGLLAGEVICIGSKPPSDPAFVRNVLPSTSNYNTDGTLSTPFSPDAAFDFTINAVGTYDSTGIAWITLMWSGTRWVYLGSNTWL